jgi:two-component system chemotaxis response regulator CheY
MGATRRNVLVVEDSSSMRSFVRSILEGGLAGMEPGLEVSEASCGFDAMRLLPRGRFDLIVTDINMADINGLELIRFIRASEQYKATPIVIISTQNTKADVDRGIALGANAYLAKPFTPEQLRDTVGKLLGSA